MTGARANQRLRTRKDLLQAASRLMREGRTPTFDEIAEAAMVSRATAYRYFAGLEALLLEAGLDVAVPTPEALFAGDTSTDPVARLERVDDALSEMMAANEPALRMLLAHTMQRSVAPDADQSAPLRQNRRGPLIAAALTPSRGLVACAELDTLAKAVTVLMGIEAVVVFKDVLQLDDAEAARVRRWAIRALVEAARRG